MVDILFGNCVLFLLGPLDGDYTKTPLKFERSIGPVLSLNDD